LPIGHALATVFVNGIPSASSIIAINGSTLVVYGMRLPNGSFQLSVTNTPGSSFTAIMSTSLTTPLSSWTVLGGVTEISPGHYQFTDTATAGQPVRFYRIRSP
jgi:hypothetical protein